MRALDLVAREGTSPPGVPACVLWAGSFNLPVLNNAGEVAFRNRLTGAGVGSANNDGIWAGLPGSLTLVARSGQSAPGTSLLFDEFDPPLIDDSGDVCFFGRVRGAGVSSANDGAIWAGDPASVQLVAREGDPAPGVGAGVSYSRLLTRP